MPSSPRTAPWCVRVCVCYVYLIIKTSQQLQFVNPLALSSPETGELHTPTVLYS